MFCHEICKEELSARFGRFRRPRIKRRGRRNLLILLVSYKLSDIFYFCNKILYFFLSSCRRDDCIFYVLFSFYPYRRSACYGLFICDTLRQAHFGRLSTSQYIALHRLQCRFFVNIEVFAYALSGLDYFFCSTYGLRPILMLLPFQGK